MAIVHPKTRYYYNIYKHTPENVSELEKVCN